MTKPHSIDAAVDRLTPRLFGIAYRMVGCHGLAEDVVQDTFVKLSQQEPLPDNIEAWCVRVATRRAIDVLRQEKIRRDNYRGPWLPDPLIEADIEDPAPTPDQVLSLAESVSTALLLVLEQLNPAERAAFLLHDVFDYSYGEIAEVLDRQEAACRQLVSRARKAVQAGRPKFEVPAQEHADVAAAFMAAVMSGDVKQVEAVLSPSAVLLSDGGGKVRAALRPMHGVDEISNILVHLAKGELASAQIVPMEINGLPGLIIRDQTQVHSATTFAIADGAVQGIYIVRNPDKLKHLA
ncbi:MAG: RNA polymerase sigma factor SigJ [Alphaproteobacteria bacterium]